MISETQGSIDTQKTEITILIVDDEVSIRRSLEGIFQDEGFKTIAAADGETALSLIRSERPSLVMLDIWMPGLDGLETLKRIREIYSELPVIMISGHASIATAVMATRLGANDFIEKPLDLNATLYTVKRALAGVTRVEEGSSVGGQPEMAEELSIGSSFESWSINPVVFSSMKLAGSRVPQRTLSKSALLYGQGLHSGRKSGLILEPLPPNSGIHFVGVSETTIVPAHVDFVESTGFATTLKLGGTQVGTIEHLMSALHAYGICNLLVKCNGEVPVLDGSAREFCSLFEDTGLEEQEGVWNEIKVVEPIRIERGKESVELHPGEGFVIDYTLQYPAPVGNQRMVFELGDPAVYKREIAPARTFGFVRDISYLQTQGLALGGRFDNFVLIGEQGPINCEFRFPDEPVRHKILDAIGDLYLLGRRISGRVVANMTGHSDNIDLLKALNEQISKAG